MNKKSQIPAVFLGIILIILILTLSSGLLSYERGILSLSIFHKYILDIIYPSEIGEMQNFKIDILVKNPNDYPIKPELEIDFQSEKWIANNRYLMNNERIPLDTIFSNDFLKYSIQLNFNFVYFFNHQELTIEQIEFERKNNPFKIKLFIDNKLVDSKEINIYVKEGN